MSRKTSCSCTLDKTCEFCYYGACTECITKDEINPYCTCGKQDEGLEMRKEDQAKFYHNLGSVLKRARVAKNITVAQLSKMSGEQHKTIKSIEDGRPCSMHHLIWMESELGIKIEEVHNYQGDNSGKETIESIQESSKESSKEESQEASKNDLIGNLI